MPRLATCPSCSARLPKDAQYCGQCGKPVGVEFDFADLEEDEELARAPRHVEPERPHGLRNLLIGGGVVAGIVVGAMLVSRESPRPEATPEATTTTTTRRTSTTSAATTTTPAYQERTLAGPLLPETTGAAVYGVTEDRELIRLEVDSGKLSVRQVDLDLDLPVPQLLARASGVVMLTQQPELVMMVDGPATAPLELSDDYSEVLPGPADDQLWEIRQVDGAGSGAPSWQYQLLRTDATALTAPVALPPFNWLLGDGRGGLLSAAYGGTYQLDPAGGPPSRVLEGMAVGASATTLVDIRCDEALTCRWRVTDRGSGRQRLLPEPVSASALQRFQYRPGSLSPDGAWLSYYDDANALWILDLTSGAVRQLGASVETFCCLDPSWSPDGHWLFWASLGKLQAWRAGTADPVSLAGDAVQGLTTVAVGRSVCCHLFVTSGELEVSPTSPPGTTP